MRSEGTSAKKKPANEPRDPGCLLLIITGGVLALSGFVGYRLGIIETGNPDFARGRALGAVFLPLIVMLLFSIAKPFRTPFARVLIVFIGGLVFLVGQMMRLAEATGGGI